MKPETKCLLHLIWNFITYLQRVFRAQELICGLEIYQRKYDVLCLKVILEK